MTEAPKTAKGRASRERIVAAASELVAQKGIAETSIDDVLERASASKSQLYHYFEDRGALLRGVVQHNADRVIGGIGPLDSWTAIRAWFDQMVRIQIEHRGCGGCPIGSLVPQLAENDEEARAALAASFERWEAHLRDGLRAMQRRGKLRRGTDPALLATATMTAIQGGLLLTQAKRDPGQLAIAVDAAYAHLRTYAKSHG